MVVMKDAQLPAMFRGQGNHQSEKRDRIGATGTGDEDFFFSPEKRLIRDVVLKIREEITHGVPFHGFKKTLPEGGIEPPTRGL